MNLHRFIPILACFAILMACSSPTETESAPFLGFNPPIVTGILVTDAGGPDVRHVWRSPSYQEGSRSNVQLYSPYPNPTNNFFSLNIRVSIEQELKIFMVPAFLPSEVHSTKAVQNGFYRYAGNQPIAILAHKTFQRGDHLISSYPILEEQNVPAGFYRIYVQGKNLLLFHDVLLYKPGTWHINEFQD